VFGNLGMSELIIIAGIALVVIGPEKFPEFAKISLRAFRDFRGYWDDIKREMNNELRPVKSELQKLSKYNPEDYVENIANAVTSIDDEEEDISENGDKTPQDDTPVDSDPDAEDAPPPETSDSDFQEDAMPVNKAQNEPDDIPEENPERLDM